MRSNNNIAKYRRPKNINVGVIVFIIIFIYVFISVFLYFTKDHLTIYEVNEGSTADDYVLNGLVFREEELVSTDTAGYINYYHREGERVSKNSILYSIDENQYSYNLINSTDENASIPAEDEKNIKNDILNFQKDYNEGNFTVAYNLKSNLENAALEIVNDSKLSSLNSILSENSSSNNLKVVHSDSSGIITYYMDNYENLNIDSATSKDFNQENYSKIQLRSTDLLEKNSPVYKIITSDNWSILLLLDKSQYEVLQDSDYVSMTFREDGLKTTVPISVFQKGTDYFAKLDMDKYMIRYLDQRYLSIEIEVNSASGLKIPVTSIVEKEFFKVPQKYFTIGGDSDSDGLIKEVKESKNGEEKVDYVFVQTDIYYKDDDYWYVDGRLFEKGDVIQGENSDDTFIIKDTDTLKGVFNVNKGYAVFRRIEILFENEEYCIIKKGTVYGLSVFDHIALEGNTAVEQDIIY